MRRSRLIGAILVLVVIGGGVVAYRYGPQIMAAVNPPAVAPARADPPPVAVKIAAVGRGEVREELHSLGMLKARQSVPISSPTGGVVTAISFREGAVVDAGSTLVQLDTRIAQAQYDAAVAQLKAAQVRLGRSTELSGAGYKSKQSLDDDRTSVDAATSDLAVRRANLELLSMRAPFRGEIGQKLFGLGEYVTRGEDADLAGGPDGAAAELLCAGAILSAAFGWRDDPGGGRCGAGEEI